MRPVLMGACAYAHRSRVACYMSADNWEPLQIKLPPPAKDFIQKLLCNVDDRLGTRTGAAEVKVHRPLPS